MTKKIIHPDVTTNIPVAHEEKKEDSRYNLKFDYELYKEEDNSVMPVIRVKYINSTTSNPEKWKVMENNEVLFIVEGDKLNKKEKEFLKSIDGVNFLISEVKSGTRNFATFKKNLKK